MAFQKAIVSLVFLGFLCGCGIPKPSPVIEVEELYPKKFEEVWKHVVKHSLTKLQDNKEEKFKCFSSLLTGGLASCLKDPYAKYFTKTEWDAYQSEEGSSYVGVGLVLVERGSRTSISSVMRDTPARKSKSFRRGDLIEKIDGVSVLGESLSDVVDKIHGLNGTNVAIQVRRDDKLMSPVVLRRAEIVESAIEHSPISKDIYYIKISEFNRTFFGDFFTAFASAVADEGGEIMHCKPLRSVVIDLRNNLGGFLISVKLASYLFALHPDDLVVTLKTNSGEDITSSGNIIEQVRKINPLFEIPAGIFASAKMVILVNDSTASAAEIMAALLREWLGVPIVGVRTYGKGSVQDENELSDGDGIRLTTAEYFVGNRQVKINKVGMNPDYWVDNNDFIEGENDSGSQSIFDLRRDLQLRKAIEILRLK